MGGLALFLLLVSFAALGAIAIAIIIHVAYEILRSYNDDDNQK